MQVYEQQQKKQLYETFTDVRLYMDNAYIK